MSRETGPSPEEMGINLSQNNLPLSSNERNNPSLEEIKQNKKNRTISDSQLLKAGADYVGNDEGTLRLEVTKEQINDAHDEMEGFKPG